MLKQLWNDEAGVVLSAELVIILTIAVIAMVVGVHLVAKSVTMELNDVSNAIGALDQSYYYQGLSSPHSAVPGSAFNDRQDGCDCSVIMQPPPVPKADAGTTPENGINPV